MQSRKALITVFVLLVTNSADAEVIYTQSPPQQIGIDAFDQTTGSFFSNVGGQEGADQFSLPGDLSITDVTWYGLYQFSPEVNPTSIDFSLSFWADAGGVPATNASVAENVTASVQPTGLQVIGGFFDGRTIFEFSAPLASPVSIPAGHTTWISIAADDPSTGQWLWSFAPSAPGDSKAFRSTSPSFPSDWQASQANGNLAFILKGSQSVDIPRISFHGPLSVIQVDNGGAVYSGVPIGSNFTFEFDLVTGLSTISDGTIVTPFTVFFEAGSFFEFTNDYILEPEDVALVNSIAGTSFAVGDLVDLIEIAGETLASGGGLIEMGVSYVLDPLAFDDQSPDNFPPNPDDILTTIFFIGEEAERGLTISFDTFDNLGSDAIAIDVHVNGALVGRNLTNPFTDGLFVPVSVGFDADGTLDLTFDGNPIFVDLPTGFTPLGFDRFGFGGRTGAGNEVNRVDNVSISACRDTFGCPPPDAEYINDFSASVGPASLFGDAVLDSGSVRLTDSINFQIGSLVINDLVPGGAVASFEATFDLQMGPSSGPPGPADGISFNLGPLPDGAFGEGGADTGETIYEALGVVDSSLVVIDSDGDGVPDEDDAFPNDSNESVDTDGNGIGNNADTDDDGDGMPDDYELANELDPLNATDANADADGDGFTNLEEFRRGTDPQNAADFPIVPVAIFTILGQEEQ